jgi:fatty acid desaturase
MTAQSLGQPRPGDPRLSRGTSSYTELARRVRASGLLDRRLGYYWLSFGAAVLALAIVAAAVVRVGDSWWQLALAAALGVVLTQFGFLGHDAAHRQIFRSARWNEAAARVLSGAFTGLSYAWWKGKHDRHHAAPNQEGRDPDIAPGALAFTRGAAESRTGTVSRWALRRQGWLFFPLLTLEGVALHWASLRRLTAPGTVGRWPEMTLILTRLTSYVAVMFLLLPPLKAAMFVAVQLAVFGLCLGGSFAPNHKGMPIVPHTARIDFLRRQVLMSRNIRGGPVVDVLMGGLNYQIEHHLFPSMPRPNLKRVQPMVRAYCQEIDVPYAELGLLASYAVVVSYLNDVGLRARDPFDCPLAADLRTGLPAASGRARS